MGNGMCSGRNFKRKQLENGGVEGCTNNKKCLIF